MGHFTCNKKKRKEKKWINLYFIFFLCYVSDQTSKYVFPYYGSHLCAIQVRNRRPTVFKGEAVHDGHPIEPVLVAGVAHGKDAWAITQQYALQPAGNIPCVRRNTENPQKPQWCHQVRCIYWSFKQVKKKKKSPYLLLLPCAPPVSPLRSWWSSWPCWQSSDEHSEESVYILRHDNSANHSL